NLLSANFVGENGDFVVMSIRGTQVAVQPPKGGAVGAELGAVALTPWAVRPVRDPASAEAPRARVLSLDQQSGRILVSMDIEGIGILNGFAAEDEVPAIGEEIAVQITWSEGRALQSVDSPREGSRSQK